MKTLILILNLLLLGFTQYTFCQSTQVTTDGYKVIEIVAYKYDYSILAISLSSNDTVTIISDKTNTQAEGQSISVNNEYNFILTPLFDINKVPAKPSNTFTFRAKDLRTLWKNGQDLKFIPYKASNLIGPILID
jgi:hypothetical protein